MREYTRSRFIVASLLLGSIFAAGFAVIFASTTFRADRIDNYLQQTATTGWIESDAVWRKVEQSAQFVVDLAPRYSRAHAQLGELYAWRGHAQRLWTNRARIEFEKSNGYWFSALSRSPADGLLWARAASVIDQHDAQLGIALATRAMSLAPFEPEAQQGFSLVMMRRWGGLDAPVRKRFLDIVVAVTQGTGDLRPFYEAARHVGREQELRELVAAAGQGTGTPL